MLGYIMENIFQHRIDRKFQNAGKTMTNNNTDLTVEKIVDILNKSNPLPDISRGEINHYRYLDEGHINSFAIMGFIIELEDAFDIQLTPEDTQSEEFRTIGGIAKIIDKRNA